MSAVQKGQSDIYLFNLRGRNFEQLTNDIYDDLYPAYDITGTRVLFSSNRPVDTLGVDYKTHPAQNNLDLFALNIYDRTGNLLRITSTTANEINPIAYDSLRIAYLSDKNQVLNRFIAEMDAPSVRDTTEHYRYFSGIYADQWQQKYFQVRLSVTEKIKLQS